MLFPVNIEFVNDTERKLGMKFPPAYVNKMVKLNGGTVQTPPDAWELYPIFDTSDKKRLKRTCNDVVRETKNAHDWPDFLPQGVAIGNNGCGDQLVLLPQPNDPELLAHEVYWWDHETGNLHQVANDFGDLISCQVDPRASNAAIAKIIG